MNRFAQPGQSLCDGRPAENHDERLGKDGFNIDIQRSSAVTGHGVFHNATLGLHGGADADQSWLAVCKCFQRFLNDNRLRTAADPAPNSAILENDALSPGLPEMGASKRTTWAVTNGSPFASSSAALARNRSNIIARFRPLNVLLERKQALEVVRWCKDVHVRQGGTHASSERLIAFKAE